MPQSHSLLGCSSVFGRVWPWRTKKQMEIKQQLIKLINKRPCNTWKIMSHQCCQAHRNKSFSRRTTSSVLTSINKAWEPRKESRGVLTKTWLPTRRLLPLGAQHRRDFVQEAAARTRSWKHPLWRRGKFYNESKFKRPKSSISFMSASLSSSNFEILLLHFWFWTSWM